MKFLFQLTEDEFEELISKRIRLELEKLQVPSNDPQQINNGALLKIGHVTEILSVSKKTIHNWIKLKKLKCHYLGGRLFFKREDIDKCLQSNLKK